MVLNILQSTTHAYPELDVVFCSLERRNPLANLFSILICIACQVFFAVLLHRFIASMLKLHGLHYSIIVYYVISYLYTLSTSRW